MPIKIKKMAVILLFFPCFAFANCFAEASSRYAIKQTLLKAIVYTESRFNKEAVNCVNSTKGCDYGFAQINLSVWGSKLKEFNISLSDLNNPCQNLMFGAWVLAQNFKSHGRNWNSVGAYNAGFRKSRKAARETYISLIKKNITLLEK